jgi:hypothetical protein
VSSDHADAFNARRRCTPASLTVAAKWTISDWVKWFFISAVALWLCFWSAGYRVGPGRLLYARQYATWDLTSDHSISSVNWPADEHGNVWTTPYHNLLITTPGHPAKQFYDAVGWIFVTRRDNDVTEINLTIRYSSLDKVLAAARDWQNEYGLQSDVSLDKFEQRVRHGTAIDWVAHGDGGRLAIAGSNAKSAYWYFDVTFRFNNP